MVKEVSKSEVEIAGNDAATRDLRRHRERCTLKRPSTAPRTMRPQETFDGTENDVRTRDLRQHRERCTHKRPSTAPRTMRPQETFDGTENDAATRDLR
ncbi:hypothetical protein PoB_004283300 [Plakobranchus ocellatus]|uniref:Uncharacterized protein n=1 Tax=Plakobranchus ocellatus TaxID=259542 RepID=A0AAV4B9S7_9GAST|nr:hypothetical protein PoB_004283300 [Plakobranchus ocellatus]